MNQTEEKRDSHLQKLKKEFRGLLYLFAGFLFHLLCPPRVRENRILLFRPERIGDYLVFTPLVRALREAYPTHEIRIVVSSEIQALAQHTPGIDGLFIRERDRRYELKSRLKNLLEIRRWGAGTAIYPSQNREIWVDEMMIWSGAKKRIGLIGNTHMTRSWMLHLGQFAYTKILRMKPDTEMNNMGHILESLQPGKKIIPQPYLGITEKGEKSVSSILNKYELNPFGKEWVLIAPLAKDRIRRWKTEGFAEIIRKLYQTQGLATVLIGGPDDQEKLEEVLKQSGDTPVHICAGTLPITELAELASHAKLFLGVESGPLHFATAAGTPSLCIMGGGLFGQFYPYGDPTRNRVISNSLPCFGCKWKCIHETVRCLQEITVHQVWQEVSDLLDLHKNRDQD
ncbi:MAG: glycosyltransferase family 9 protein [Planctomycetota bacterium]|nr:glycosyltransferase family 9 protein [Planctomycetota bacterium]